MDALHSDLSNGANYTKSTRMRSKPRAVSPSMGPVLEGLGCGSFGDRVVTSAEVTVSKIFPAGAGWQLASYVAEGSGFSPTSLAFFATVGLGDCTGVFLGHTVYQVLKKVTGAKISLGTELQVASLLGGAAFFSGSAWQPALNAFNTLGFSFTQSLVGVSLATTFAFFAGLRIMRRVLSNFMPAVEAVTYDSEDFRIRTHAPLLQPADKCEFESQFSQTRSRTSRSRPPLAPAAAHSSAPTSRSAPATGLRPSSASSLTSP